MKSKIIYNNYTIYENGEVYNSKGKKLSPVDNGKGYLVLNIFNTDGKRICKSVHRLLAEAFIPNPLNLPEVNHIDGVRTNNSLDNLEWCTHSENVKHSYYLKNKTVTGENNPKCKTNTEIVHQICKLLEISYKPSHIRDLGYDYNLIRAIKSRKNWKFISDLYKF